MKVGLFSSYDYSHPGGVINHVTHLAHHLQIYGHNVKVIAPSFGKVVPYFEQDVKSVGLPLPIPYGGTTARIAMSPWLPYQVKRVLDKENFDIVHLHEPFIPMIGLSALAQSTAVNVGTFHACHESSALYWLGQSVVRRLGKKLHGKIAVSKPALSYISKYLPAEYKVIPNGIDTGHYRPDGPLRHEYKDGKLNILFVGRLEERKGLEDLIYACSYVKRDFPGFRLIVVGPGLKLRYRYELLAKKLIPDQIVFTGFVPFNMLADYYRTADIFCAPATGGESFGIVLLEAMASGTPVVATDIAGYSSVVTHKFDGVLARATDRQSIADALLALIHDKQLRIRLMENGLATANKYGWEHISRQVIDYYKSLLNRFPESLPVDTGVKIV